MFKSTRLSPSSGERTSWSRCWSRWQLSAMRRSLGRPEGDHWTRHSVAPRGRGAPNSASAAVGCLRALTGRMTADALSRSGLILAAGVGAITIGLNFGVGAAAFSMFTFHGLAALHDANQIARAVLVLISN